MNAETLRSWIRQAEVDAGQAEGTTSESAGEIRALKRKCRELEETTEVLRAATAFLVRDCDPQRR